MARAPIKSAGYDPTGLSLAQKVMLAGASLRDAGSTFSGVGTGDNFMQLQGQIGAQQQQRAKASALEGLNGLFAPQLPDAGPPRIDGEMGRSQATPGRIPSLTDPVTQQALARAAQAGIDTSTYIEMLKANKREFVNGQAVDPYSTPVGSRIAELDKGMTQDQGGTVQLLPGYADAARMSAGATTGGQEGAKAQYDIIPVNLPNGSTVQMSRAQLLQLQQTGQFPQLGQSATPGGIVSQQEQARSPYDLQTRKGPNGEDITASRADFLGNGPLVGQSPAEKIQTDAAAEARVGLPQAAATAQQTLELLGQLRNHPGRKFATGGTGIIPAIPGTAAKDFTTLLDQAKGQTFLTAYGSLKGAGAITEMEGKKAEQAIARLDRTQSEDGFLSAISDLEQVVRAGMQRAQQRAQPTAQRGPARGVPSVGTIQQGYRFKGGNPASSSSWERVR